MLSLLIGGLHPIVSQFVIDAVCLSVLVFVTITTDPRWRHLFALLCVVVINCSIAWAGAGFYPTIRWTINIPLIPLIFLEVIRRIAPLRNQGQKIQVFFAVLGGLLVVLSAALTIAFPAVQIPPVEGVYNVGVVDLFLEDLSSPKPSSTSDTCALQSHVSARILYPTSLREHAQSEPSSIPYIPSDIATEFCDQFMVIGAPPEIRDFGWMLHTWILNKLPARQNGPVASAPDGGFPVVVFSHGLVGTAATYSFQTMSLAAMGYVVVSVIHTDGSSPVVLLPSGELMFYDHELPKLWFSGEKEKYVRIRRERTDHRVHEMIAVTEAIHRLNEVNDAKLDNLNVSFIGKLRTERTAFMGHSFGGSTALTAAVRRPDLARFVVAHEPALDWAPDDARGSLFDQQRIQKLERPFDGGTGGIALTNTTTSSIHDLDLLFLFSDEWKRKDEAWNNLLSEMHQKERLGKKGGGSSFHYIDQSHHTEFSDISMIMPLWLSRATGLTGSRNPIETAREIRKYTLEFLITAMKN